MTSRPTVGRWVRIMPVPPEAMLPSSLDECDLAPVSPEPN